MSTCPIFGNSVASNFQHAVAGGTFPRGRDVLNLNFLLMKLILFSNKALSFRGDNRSIRDSFVPDVLSCNFAQKLDKTSHSRDFSFIFSFI